MSVPETPNENQPQVDELRELVETFRLDEERLKYPRPNFPVLRPPIGKMKTIIVVAYAGKTIDRFRNERPMYDVFDLDENDFRTLIVRHTSLARELARLLKITGSKSLAGFKLTITCTRTETQDGRVRYTYRVKGERLPEKEFREYLQLYKRALGLE
ncbi:MAG: hypothetical protein J7K15_10280 [Deltaproteobacteria bacterium]|nr:hypothetical protein [Deltaproteobacteria bacterium]